MCPPPPGAAKAPRSKKVTVFVVLGGVFGVLTVVLFAAAIVFEMVTTTPKTPFDELSLDIDLKAGVSYDVHESVSGDITKTALCFVFDPDEELVEMKDQNPRISSFGSQPHDYRVYTFKPSVSGKHSFTCVHDLKADAGSSFYLTSSEDQSVAPVTLIAVSLFVCGPVATMMFVVALIVWLVSRQSHAPASTIAPDPWDIQDAPG